MKRGPIARFTSPMKRNNSFTRTDLQVTGSYQTQTSSDGTHTFALIVKIATPYQLRKDEIRTTLFFSNAMDGQWQTSSTEILGCRWKKGDLNPKCRAALSKRSLYGWKTFTKKVKEKKPYTVKNLWTVIDTPLMDVHNLEISATRQFTQKQIPGRTHYQKRSWKLADEVPCFFGFIYGK